MQTLKITSAASSCSLEAILADRLDIELSVPMSRFADGLESLEHLALPDPGHTYDWDPEDLRFGYGLIATLIDLLPLKSAGFVQWLSQHGVGAPAFAADDAGGQ